MAAPRDYQSFVDFEREALRPDMRIGWSMDELESTGEVLDFDMDPFEAALVKSEQEDSDDD
ncbi:MAG TPA: transcriptional regulator [Polyangiaceae bacterium]|jgi:hypothetical protein